MTKALTLSNYR